MATFLKANVASLSASLLDYLVTILMVTFFKVDAVLASVIGTICGGVLNFLIGRNWVFQSKNSSVKQQALKYSVVWLGNLLLNASGMWLLVKAIKLHYIPSKIITSFLVGICYNYFLQKKYVFR